MRRFILGILIVVMAIDSIQANWYIPRVYRDEYTENSEFFRVLAGLTQVPGDIPVGAREVSLNYNMITNIPINAFIILRDCQILRLRNNEIYVIESGMFNGLVSLTELYLGYNKISAIPEGAFASLSSLKKIYLTRNSIQVIPANTFPNTLEILFLPNNKITALEDVNITKLVFLNSINLSINRISTIPANAFSTLSNCVSLSLNSNQIENIEDGAFHGLDKITRLILYLTSLTHLSQNMFDGLPSLKALQMDRSRISEIARGAFTGLDQLQTLYFYGNELTVIDSYMFSGLVSLIKLYLNKNNINDIKDYAFLPLGNLTHLYLFNNQLEHLRPSTFSGLGSLEYLDLGNNKLTTLDPLVLSPLPGPLNLALDSVQSPMVCDIKLCWLKLEEVGSIVWKVSLSFPERYTNVYYPTCTGGVDWWRLQCPATIPCSDPGEVEFAERGGSFLPFNNNSQPGLDLPYSTDFQFRHTCDPCYTGGGTITCQSNGQWTRKPECVRLDNRVICRAPVLPNGYLTPSSEQYECGVKVTYHCDEGFTLIGPPDGTCGPDGQFVDQIHRCTKNENPEETEKTTNYSPTTGSLTTSSPLIGSPKISSATTGSPKIGSLITDSPGQGTKPESGATEGVSPGLFYGIVGAVGGIVVTALIGLTIFCIKRSKKKKPSDENTVKTPNTAVGEEASEAGYTGLVTLGMKGKPGNGLNRQAEPAADRGTPGQRVTRDSTVYSNTAYEDEYQEIEDALPKDDPYADVDEDTYEN